MGLMTYWGRRPVDFAATAILLAVLCVRVSFAQTPPAGQLKCDVEGGV